MMTTWWDEISGQLRGVADALLEEVRVHGVTPLLSPIAPFDQPAVLAPAVAVGGVLAMAVLSGTAIAALGGLLLSLLALYLLLVDVFGISIELTPMRSR